MKHTFTCLSGDIELRPMTLEDSQRYRIIRNQDQNRFCFFNSEVISEESQYNWYAAYEQDETDIMFAFYYKGKFAGGNAIYHIDYEKGTGEYGRILVDKQSFPQKGLGSAITYHACQTVHRELGLSRLFAEIYEDNLPSLHACLNGGFHKAEMRTLENGRRIYYIEHTFSAGKDKP
mgnify:FL=1